MLQQKENMNKAGNQLHQVSSCLVACLPAGRLISSFLKA